MKKIKQFSLSIATIMFLLQCVSTTQQEVEEEYPILETMGYYQRFSQKVYLAGMAENWELADFYTHELEEVTEELVEANVIHDDYNLSNLSKAMLFPKIEKLEEAVRKKDQVLFLENYKLMISGCNLCHQATKHDFIKILVPKESNPWNQDFGLTN